MLKKFFFEFLKYQVLKECLLEKNSLNTPNFDVPSKIKTMLTNNLMVRDDNWELIQPWLLLLNLYPSNVPTPPIRTNGCITNSRWMVTIIYCICEPKIALQWAQLCKLGMFKSNFGIEQHRYLALFLTIIYVKPWIQCPLPFKATVNDLGFFHQLRSVQGNRIFLDFLVVLLQQL